MGSNYWRNIFRGKEENQESQESQEILDPQESPEEMEKEVIEEKKGPK